MSILEQLRQFFQEFPLLEGVRINLDCLSSDPENYSLDSVPGETVVKRYCDGSRVCRKLFTLSSRSYYGTELDQQDDNAAFFDALEQWVDSREQLMQLPDLGAHRTARSLRVLSSGYPIEVQGSDGGLLARYQAQLELIYLDQ